jgi:hypothetical protein
MEPVRECISGHLIDDPLFMYYPEGKGWPGRPEIVMPFVKW